MLFVIKRASDSINCGATWEQPCEGAICHNVISQEHHYHPTEHYTEHDVTCYTIELESLKDLIGLMEREGELIMSQHAKSALPGDKPIRACDEPTTKAINSAPSIIIYDYYVE